MKTTGLTKTKKILLAILGTLLIIILAFPFALDFYLNKKLPDLINQKTDYNLTLDNFGMSLLSGNLEADNVYLINKNTKDSTKAQIRARIGTIRINNFSIWKALFHKKYNVESVLLSHPEVSVTLGPKKQDSSKNTKKLDLIIKNILVENGNVTINNHNGTPLFNGKNVNIKLTDIKQSDDASKIPLAFKDFKVDAQDVIISINEFYRIDAKKIEAKNKTLLLDQFHLKPLQIARYYDSKNVFDLSAQSLSATDFVVSQDSLIVSKIQFLKPDLKVTSTGKKTVEKDPKDLDLKIGVKNLDFQQGKVLVLQPNLQKTASVDQFNFTLSDIVFDKNTVKEKIPFHFGNHDIEAENIYFKTDAQHAIKINKINSANSDISVHQFRMIPLVKSSHKDIVDISTDKILIHKNQSKYIGQKLNLNFAGIDIVNPKVTLFSSKSKSQKKAKNNQFPDFLAQIGKINIINGHFKQLSHGKEKMSAGKINVQFAMVKSDPKIIKQDIPFSSKSHSIQAKNISIDAGKYYNLKLASVSNVGKETTVHQLEFLPKYSRAGFSKVIPVEEDLYTIRTKMIRITDKSSVLFGKKPVINLEQVVLDGVNCNIYHDLAPPDDNSPRYLFSKKLRNVKIPLFVNQVLLKNSSLSYEENADNANIPGKLTFEKFNATIHNVNNGKINGLPTLVTVDTDFLFYGTAPTQVTWKFDVKNPEDQFTIVGNINKLSADNVNLFVRPYLNITLDGKIDYVKFDYHGTNQYIAGKFYFKYKNMYVNFLNKKNGKERKLLGTVANWFIRNESTGKPEHVNIKKERDPSRSFFNLLWQGIMEGLKKYLI